MFPFKGLGQIASLLSNPQRIREEMEQLQQRVGQITAEGDAGAGMVKVRVNGRMEVLGFTLSDEALRSGDREMVEDLLRAATNQALDKARKLVAEETAKMATSLGLPAGMSLPGVGLPGLS
jgi:DNA-binding YbaB/EbfC family protein